MSASAGVVAKAGRLRVLAVSPYMALVQSGATIYVVRFTPLACSCPAGLVGRTCSHAIAAMAARDGVEVGEVEV